MAGRLHWLIPTAGGNGVYYFHYLPLLMEHGCNDSPGTFGMLTVDGHYKIQQPLAQFFTAQMINLEWVVPGDKQHDVFSASSDINDGAGHAMVTAYALKRPDGQWSLLVVNRDQQNAHRVKIVFENQDGEGQDRGRIMHSMERLRFPYSEKASISGIPESRAPWDMRNIRLSLRLRWKPRVWPIRMDRFCT